jgi:hypothetical protein
MEMEDMMSENNNHNNFTKLPEPSKRSIDMPGFDQLPASEKREIVRDEIHNILTKDRETNKLSFAQKLSSCALGAIVGPLAVSAMSGTMNCDPVINMVSFFTSFGVLTVIDHMLSKKEKETAIQNDINALQSKSGYVFSKEQMDNEVEVIKTELKNKSSLSRTLKNAQQSTSKTSEPAMVMPQRYSGR